MSFAAFARKGLVGVVAALLALLVGCTGAAGGAGGSSGEPSPDDGIQGTDGVGPGASQNTSGIVRFSFRYSNPYGMCGYSYTVALEENGQVTFGYSADGYPEDQEMSCVTDTALLTELQRLYEDHNVAQWNGFHKINTNVLDGDGFSLDIAFANEESLGASGSNIVPEGYLAYKQALDQLFEPLVQQVAARS